MIESIRILPSDKATFPTKKDFEFFINNIMVARGGLYYFPGLMMNCPPNTLVLFQYDGKIRAVGILVEAIKKPVLDEKNVKYSGYYKFDLSTLHYLTIPLDANDLRKAYPRFISFNQSKQKIPLECLVSILSLLDKEGISSDYYPAIFDGNNDVELISFEGMNREAVVNVRVNQDIYRRYLLKRYRKCCLCGVSNPSLLVASHIKPWAVSNPSEKADINNGFIMCPNHDKLFDRGFISFEDDGRIIISKELSDEDQEKMSITKRTKIKLTNENKLYLKYHRENVFKK